jgi:hypothetical protein
MAPAQCHSMELRMHILWTIIIGFVAGVIAKLIHSGPNEPTGFILTTISWHRRRVRRDIPRAGDRLVSCRRRDRVYRLNSWSCDRSTGVGLCCPPGATRIARLSGLLTSGEPTHRLHGGVAKHTRKFFPESWEPRAILILLRASTDNPAD